ncbi:MAG: RNA-binding protein S1, partial [Ruthenibacterium sp.]
ADVLSEGQTVKVKVLSITDGKIALSIKRTMEQPVRRPQRSDMGRVWQPKSSSAPAEMSFEEKMSQFKTRSEEKISDLRKVTEAHRGGGYSRKGH